VTVATLSHYTRTPLYTQLACHHYNYYRTQPAVINSLSLCYYMRIWMATLRLRDYSTCHSVRLCLRIDCWAVGASSSVSAICDKAGRGRTGCALSGWIIKLRAIAIRKAAWCLMLRETLFNLVQTNESPEHFPLLSLPHHQPQLWVAPAPYMNTEPKHHSQPYQKTMSSFTIHSWTCSNSFSDLIMHHPPVLLINQVWAFLWAESGPYANCRSVQRKGAYVLIYRGGWLWVKVCSRG